jgi:hypothetical protein
MRLILLLLKVRGFLTERGGSQPGILRHFKYKATQQGLRVACRQAERAVATPLARMTPTFGAPRLLSVIDLGLHT